jgi:hypothetical protein
VWTIAINFRRKGLPRMQLYSISKLATLNVSISLRLLSPILQDTSKSMRPMGEDDYPGIIPWKVSCIEVNYAKLRSISMKVFLVKRLREAPQSISVLATLCHPISIFTMKGKFLSDSFVSRWSSCLNVILRSDHFILLLGSMR